MIPKVGSDSSPGRYSATSSSSNAAHVATVVNGKTKSVFVDWEEQRLFTPGSLVVESSPQGQRFKSVEKVDSVQIFSKKHGVALIDDQPVGASVEATLSNLTARKNQKKSTYIQYEKTHIKKGDFKVDAENYRGCSHYQGGHLIDYKFGTQISHESESNYFPVHYFYNTPLKESLVNQSQCEAYLEILLYTEYPPEIKLKGKQTMHSIPVAVVLVRINQGTIEDAYCFPNNKFDYKALESKFQIKGSLGKQITPYFKLKSDFYPLFLPAIQFVDDDLQKKHEKKFLKVVSQMDPDPFANGGSTLIGDLVANLHFDKELNADLFLDLSDDEFELLNEDSSLKMPFEYLGRFLKEYLVNNALKTEKLNHRSKLQLQEYYTDLNDTRFFLETESFTDELEDEIKSVEAALFKNISALKPRKIEQVFENFAKKFSYEHIQRSYSGNNEPCEDFHTYMRELNNLELYLSDSRLQETFVKVVKWACEGLENLLKTMSEDLENLDIDCTHILKNYCRTCLKLNVNDELFDRILALESATDKRVKEFHEDMRKLRKLKRAKFPDLKAKEKFTRQVFVACLHLSSYPEDETPRVIARLKRYSKTCLPFLEDLKLPPGYKKTFEEMVARGA